MKDKKYHTVGIVQQLNRKIVERGKIDTYNDHSLSWLGADTSIKKIVGCN